MLPLPLPAGRLAQHDGARPTNNIYIYIYIYIFDTYTYIYIYIYIYIHTYTWECPNGGFFLFLAVRFGGWVPGCVNKNNAECFFT